MMEQSNQQPGQPVQTGEQTNSEEVVKGPKPGKGRAQREVTEWIKALVIAGILVLVIRWFLFNPFIVDGPSMQPNFVTGERLIVNKILYDIRPPKRGEVVVFFVPEENRDFIKRVVGVPGDKVRYEGDNLYINGKKVEEPYIAKAIEEAHKNGTNYNNEGGFPNETVQEDTVPPGTILAFGDNRSNSKDGRMIGYVPYKRIIGRADVIFWPLDKIKLVRHK